jgi:hypothetical protein
VKQAPVTNPTAFEADALNRQRRASLPAIITSHSSALPSATLQRSQGNSEFISNFPMQSTAEFPSEGLTAAHAPAPALAHSAAAATVVRPAGGRLELNAKKVQVQKDIGDTEGAVALLSKFQMKQITSKNYLTYFLFFWKESYLTFMINRKKVSIFSYCTCN